MSTTNWKRSLVPLIVLALGLALSALAYPAPLADSAILLIGDGMGAAQIEVARRARATGPLASTILAEGGPGVKRSAGVGGWDLGCEPALRVECSSVEPERLA